MFISFCQFEDQTKYLKNHKTFARHARFKNKDWKIPTFKYLDILVDVIKEINCTASLSKSLIKSYQSIDFKILNRVVNKIKNPKII